MKTDKLKKYLKRRLLVLLGILLVGLGLFCYYWFWDGFAPNDADLRLSYKPIPANKNGFGALQQAGKALKFSDEDFFKVKDILDGRNWDAAYATALLEHNEQALRLYFSSLASERLQVPPVRSSEADLAYLNDWETLAQLTVLKVRLRHREKRDGEAFALLRQLLELAWRAQGADGSMCHCLFGLKTQRLAAIELLRLTPECTLAPEVLAAGARELGRYRENQAGILRGCKLEYAVWTADLEKLKTGAYKGAYRNLRGVLAGYDHDTGALKINRTRSKYARFWRRLIANLAKPWSERSPLPITRNLRVKSLAGLAFDRNYVGEHIYWELTRGMAKLELKVRKHSNEVAFCQLMLALRAYKLKNGELPESLDALVPEYLRKIPKDAFDGRPLRYSRAKKLIYSVGLDLKDSGGSAPAKSSQPKTFRRSGLEYKRFWLQRDPGAPIEF